MYVFAQYKMEEEGVELSERGSIALEMDFPEFNLAYAYAVVEEILKEGHPTDNPTDFVIDSFTRITKEDFEFMRSTKRKTAVTNC